MEPVIYKKSWYKKWWIWPLLTLLLVLILFGWQVWQQARQLQLTSNNQLTAITNKPAVSSTDMVALVESYNPTWGAGQPLVQIVEWADFSCPYCQQAFVELRQFAANHPQQVQLVFRHFPITDLHPQARLAAIAAVCAQEQGKFWPFHDKLFINQGNHQEVDLLRYASEVGLNIAQWQQCRLSAAAGAKVDQDFKSGVVLGVDGTPTFFINGYKVAGVLPLQTWEQILDRLIK